MAASDGDRDGEVKAVLVTCCGADVWHGSSMATITASKITVPASAGLNEEWP
jgi:hypothetical protein